MFIFRKNEKMQKNNIKMSGKRGFTLVELSVVLALVAIITAMIVSFSIMMNNFFETAQAEYDFLEDSNTLKNQIIKKISEYDNSENTISVQNKKLQVKSEDSEDSKNIDLSDLIGDNFKVEFAAGENNLIRCTVISKNSNSHSTSFVIALRSAQVVKEVVSDE